MRQFNSSKSLPSNLCDLLSLFVDHKVPILPNPKNYTNEDFQQFLIISKFSYVATIMYALEQAKPLDQYEKLQIHIVGAEKDKINFNRSTCSLLFALLPNVTLIELVFCGPHITTADEKIFEKYEYSDAREVDLHSNKTLYQYYTQSETAKKHPNLIVAYNCGFSEYAENPELNSWPNGIGQMLQFKNIPIVFTSFTQNESTTDYNVFMQQAMKMNVEVDFLVKNMINPYRDVRPLRNWEITSGEEIYYVNNYIHIAKARNCDF
jgi:mitochondrial splicing suppressor protein 51